MSYGERFTLWLHNRKECYVLRLEVRMEDASTYSPLAVVPKLLPTTPVQVHSSPAFVCHIAVAVSPTLRQVTDAEASDVMDATTTKRDLRVYIMS
jgi:hypothetical protein